MQLAWRKIGGTIALVLLCLTVYWGCSRRQTTYSHFRGLPIDSVAARGVSHLQVGNTDSATLYLTAIPNMALDDGTPQQQRAAAASLCQAADLLTTASIDYVQAYEALLAARTLSEIAEADSLRAEIQFRLAGVNYMFHDYDKSSALIDSVFDESTRHRWQNLVLKSISNIIAKTFTSSGEYEKYLSQMARFDTLRLTPSARERFVRHFRKAAEQNYRNDINATLQSLDSCNRYITPEWDDGQAGYVLSSLRALLYRSLGRYPEAIACIRTWDKADPERQFRMYNGLWRCYEAMGEKDSAHLYAEKKYSVMDTVFNVARYGSLRSLELRTQMENDAKEYRVLQVKSDMHLLLFWVALGAAVVIALLLWRVLKARQRLLARNKELYRMYLEHRAGEQRLMELAMAKPNSDEPEKSPEHDKYGSSALSEAEMLEIVARCRAAIQQSEAPYNPGFGIDELAELTGINKRYISQSINGALGQNFPTFMAEVRVARACTLLTSPEGRRLTMEGIAESVGFRSRSHFVTVFKRVTGLTPTDYQRAAE